MHEEKTSSLANNVFNVRICECMLLILRVRPCEYARFNAMEYNTCRAKMKSIKFLPQQLKVKIALIGR